MERGKKENFVALCLSVTAHLVLLLVSGLAYRQGLPGNRTPRFSVMPVILTAALPSLPEKGRGAAFIDKGPREDMHAVKLAERGSAIAGLQKGKRNDLLSEEIAPAAASVAADARDSEDRNKDRGGREMPVAPSLAPPLALSDAGGKGYAGEQPAVEEEGSGRNGGTGLWGNRGDAKTAFADMDAVSSSRRALDGDKGRGGSGVTSAAPLYGENPLPAYPILARRRGYEGAVTLSVEVLADGKVGRLEMKKSSGYELLDRTAWETVKRWKFSPAKKSGKPVTMWVYVPVKFELN